MAPSPKRNFSQNWIDGLTFGKQMLQKRTPTSLFAIFCRHLKGAQTFAGTTVGKNRHETMRVVSLVAMVQLVKGDIFSLPALPYECPWGWNINEG